MQGIYIKTEDILTVTTYNERGQISAYTLGNGLSTSRGYNEFGMPTSIATPGIQNLQCDFDILTGNLNWRKDEIKGLQENFTYDAKLQNRLATWKVNTATADTVLYADNGNIDWKSGLDSFKYESGRPHAVSEIANTGNIVSTELQNITYTPFNKVEIIEEGDYRLVFTYGPDNSRKKTDLYKLRNKKWNWQKTKYFVSGGYELEVEGVQQYEKHLNYIYGADGLAAIFEIDNNNPNLYYVHKDHLGSFQSITDNTGALADKLSFGPWGARRDTSDWSFTSPPSEFLFDRGFTGHEHLDEFNLINMNGRVYDPILGRFLSPDNYVQLPDYTQSLNRYSYALNNPLVFTDPSGESWKSFWNKIGGFLTRNNIQFNVGANMSGSGTVPFANIYGPNFYVDTQNFAAAPTAGYQKINQQLAGFSGMGMYTEPQLDMPFGEFIGMSPLAGGVASSSGGRDWIRGKTYGEGSMLYLEVEGHNDIRIAGKVFGIGVGIELPMSHSDGAGRMAYSTKGAAEYHKYRAYGGQFGFLGRRYYTDLNTGVQKKSFNVGMLGVEDGYLHEINWFSFSLPGISIALKTDWSKFIQEMSDYSNSYYNLTGEYPRIRGF